MRATLSGLLLAACLAVGCGEEAAILPEKPAEATPAAFNVEGAPTVEFSVPDMMCEESCCPQVRETLAAQPGVKDVKVELETKIATVAVDKDRFDAKAAIAALKDIQFVHTTLVTDEEAPAQN
jgi:copper chaperone CopZ